MRSHSRPHSLPLKPRLEVLEDRCVPSSSHWLALNSGTTATLNSVSSNDVTGPEQFAAGANGTILQSTDQGASWTAQTSGTTASLNGITGGGAVAVAVGANGTILQTTNHGTTWTAETSGTTATLYGVSNIDVNFARLFAVGANGTILHSSDEGVTWTAETSGTTATLYAVNGLTNGAGFDFFAVGDGGLILHSSDLGATWTPQTSGTTNTLYSVFADNFGTAGQIAVGAGGAIVHSANLGTTWTVENSGTTAILRGVQGFDKAYAVGDNGTILISADQGATWTPAPSGTTANLRGVAASFVSGGDLNAYIAGDGGTILRFPGLHTVATGADVGGGPNVRVFDAQTGGLLADFMAYDTHFTGGVRVAMGDVDGDGDQDIITAPGPGGGPDIRIFDGITFQLIGEFAAYDPGWLGGVNVAYGLQFLPPINHGNGIFVPEIVTGADAGGGPHVKVFNGQTGQVLMSFFAYDPNFRGGVRVATLNSNSAPPPIVTAPGPSGGPDVRIWDGQTGALTGEFLAYDSHFLGGVYVGATVSTPTGLNSPPTPINIITGAGAGGGPQVKVFDPATGAVLQSFFAYDPNFTGGVRVGSITDITGNDQPEIITSPGPSGGADVRLFDSQSTAMVDEFFAYDSSWLGGVFVGA